jgi:PHD/YefM family antitoxin component YafN of YafNO toxin-antitoxin module
VKVASQNEIAANFAAYVKATKAGPVVVTSKGKPVAVLLRSEGDDLERLLMGYSPKLQSILEAARKRFKEGQGISHETFWNEVEAENARKLSSREGTAKPHRKPHRRTGG